MTKDEALEKKAENARELGLNYEPEPVVWMYQDKSTHEVRFQKHMRGFVDHGATYETPLYTTPPQRKPPQFPTMLRKMWSGREVQDWINENWNKGEA